MAFVQLNCHSDTLGMAITINAIVPQATGVSQIGMAGGRERDSYPVLYLLHGLSDDHSIWCRRTAIERYAAAYDLAVVMPNVHRSYYTDMAHGLQYWAFVSEELPRLAQHFLPISPERKDTFVAGLSMGGYGAFKLALNCPERFAAAASLSGALDPTVVLRNHDGDRNAEWHDIFGSPERFVDSKNDLRAMLRQQVAGGVELPLLWQHCGTEDFLYADNIAFRDFASEHSVPIAYSEGPGGHSWDVWDAQIQHVLSWLPLD